MKVWDKLCFGPSNCSGPHSPNQDAPSLLTVWSNWTVEMEPHANKYQVTPAKTLTPITTLSHSYSLRSAICDLADPLGGECDGSATLLVLLRWRQPSTTQARWRRRPASSRPQPGQRGSGDGRKRAQGWVFAARSVAGTSSSVVAPILGMQAGAAARTRPAFQSGAWWCRISNTYLSWALVCRYSYRWSWI